MNHPSWYIAVPARDVAFTVCCSHPVTQSLCLTKPKTLSNLHIISFNHETASYCLPKLLIYVIYQQIKQITLTALN